MNKLPVGKTILGAYGFTFGHLGTIIGLIWAPLVISTLLYILPTVAASYGANADGGVATGTGAIAVWLLMQLLAAIICVAVTRQALGLRQGPATFYFALGQPEYRVFGAILLVVYAPLLFYSLCLVAAATIASGQGGGGPAALAVALLLLVGGPALAYIIIRVSYLVVPVTVSENQLNFARGWVLTRGNFWRIFVVLLAVSLPIYLLEILGRLILMGSEVAAVLPPNGNLDPHAMQRYITALMGIINRHMPAVTGIDLILAPFGVGLSLSASAFAYRELSAPSPTV
jgi:hypothetical protein